MLDAFAFGEVTEGQIGGAHLTRGGGGGEDDRASRRFGETAGRFSFFVVCLGAEVEGPLLLMKRPSYVSFCDLQQ